MRRASFVFGLLILSLTLASSYFGCAGKRPIDRFDEGQKSKMVEKSVYVDADFEFWAAMYEPTIEDLEQFRTAWLEHGDAFPESKAFAEVETETRRTSQRVVLVSLFMTSYENADLREKSLGWSIYPVPLKVTELNENDVVLRALMPVRNPWARYFLLRYAPETWGESQQLVVSNRNARVELRKLR